MHRRATPTPPARFAWPRTREIGRSRIYQRTFDVCGFTVAIRADLTPGATRADVSGTVRATWEPPAASSVNERVAFRHALEVALGDFARRFNLTIEGR